MEANNRLKTSIRLHNNRLDLLAYYERKRENTLTDVGIHAKHITRSSHTKCSVGYKKSQRVWESFSLCLTVHTLQDIKNPGFYPLNSKDTSSCWGQPKLPLKMSKAHSGAGLLSWRDTTAGNGLNIAFIHIFTL